MMNLEFAKERIKEIKRRLENNSYRIQSYLELNDKNKRTILDDFEYLIETVYYLNKAHLSKGKWWYKKGQEFAEPFTAFWLSRYLSLIYLNHLNYDKVAYSFLSD